MAIFDPTKIALCNRYLNLLRNKHKRDYGFAYVNFLRNGATGNEPERGQLSYLGAQAVRMQVDSFKLWEDAA